MAHRSFSFIMYAPAAAKVDREGVTASLPPPLSEDRWESTAIGNLDPYGPHSERHRRQPLQVGTRQSRRWRRPRPPICRTLAGREKPRPALLREGANPGQRWSRGSASSIRRALVNTGVRGLLAERPLFGRRPPGLRESRPRMVQGAEHRAPIDPGHYPGLKGTPRVPKSPKTRD